MPNSKENGGPASSTTASHHTTLLGTIPSASHITATFDHLLLRTNTFTLFGHFMARKFLVPSPYSTTNTEDAASPLGMQNIHPSVRVRSFSSTCYVS